MKSHTDSYVDLPTDSGEGKSIHWRQAMGNPFLQRLTPQMLTAEGALISRHIKAPKARTAFDSKRLVLVRYDRDYVIEKICSAVFVPLEPEPKQYNDIQALFHRAWRLYRSRVEASNAEVSDYA